jgi:protein-S-isoprenylcysteine O-methyltransferase Ste14
MYLGAGVVIVGAGLVRSSPAVVILGVVFVASMHVLVVLYEEPSLADRFGVTYEAYRSSVHRWLIRRPHSRGKEFGRSGGE